jgi:hypothetical protein
VLLLKRYEPFIAAAIIMIAVMAGWLLMPRIMLAASGGGPVVGLIIGLAFILSLFLVLWLRARWQRRSHRD